MATAATPSVAQHVIDVMRHAQDAGDHRQTLGLRHASHYLGRPAMSVLILYNVFPAVTYSVFMSAPPKALFVM